MKKFITTFFVLFLISLSAQSGDISLQDVKIEGNDNKSADFHLVKRDLSKYEFIENPLDTRYKYFAPVNTFSTIKDSVKEHESYTEFEAGTKGNIYFKTAYRDGDKKLLRFNAGYNTKKYSSDWHISAMEFNWTPFVLNSEYSIEAFEDKYKLHNIDNNYSGFNVYGDFSRLLALDRLTGLYCKVELGNYDSDNSKSLASATISSNYAINDVNKLSLDLTVKNDYFHFNASDRISIKKSEISVMLQGDNDLIFPTVGWELPLVDSSIGVLSFNNRPTTLTLDYRDNLANYHYLDISRKIKSQFSPINASLVYGSSRIIPFNVSLFHKYLLNYGYISLYDYTNFNYKDIQISGIAVNLSYNSKHFNVANDSVIRYFDHQDIKLNSLSNYKQVPYLSSFENKTTLDIVIDKFLFNTLIVYKNSRYSHLNEKLDPMYRLDCKLEYRLKREYSFYLLCENIVKEGAIVYSNYEEEPFNLGIGLKISLR